MLKSLNLPMTGKKVTFSFKKNMTGEADELTILLNKRILPPLSQKKLIAVLLELIQVGGELEANFESEQRNHD